MYNRQLARAILEKLDEEFPRKVHLNELQAELQIHQGLPHSEWLSAVQALRLDGALSGKFLPDGSSIADAAALYITDRGRLRLRESAGRVENKVDTAVDQRGAGTPQSYFMDDLFSVRNFWMVTDFPDRPIVVDRGGGVFESLGSSSAILRPAAYVDAASGSDISAARVELLSQNPAYLLMRPSGEGAPLMEAFLFRYIRRMTVPYRRGNPAVQSVWANEYGAVSPGNMYGWDSDWSRGVAGRFLVGSPDPQNLWRIRAMDGDYLGRRTFVIGRDRQSQSENLARGPLENPNAPPLERFDLFLSHSSEDKAAIARPLYEALVAKGVKVWFDEAVLKMGDSLSSKIDEGLARCPHGLVIISPSFLAKRWPQRELAGLVAREMAGGKKVILPIWHDIDETTLVEQSPTLADRVAGRSSDGIDALVAMILDVIR